VKESVYIEIIADVRKIREAHAKYCGFDIKAIAKDIKKGEKRLSLTGWKIIRKEVPKMKTNYIT